MVTVSGRLLDFVEDPSNVAQVQVRAREVRPHGDGVMLDHPVKVDYAPPTGTVTFDAAAGTAGVIMWHAVGESHASGSLPIIVPDTPTATLADCVRLVGLADDATRSELERLAAEALAAVQGAAEAVREAGEAVVSAGGSATAAASSATAASQSEQAAEDWSEVSEDAAAISLVTAEALDGIDLLEANRAIDLIAGKADKDEVAAQSGRYESVLGATIQALDILSYDVEGSNFIPSTLGRGLLRTSPTTGATEVAPGSGLYALAGVDLIPDPRDPHLYRIGA